MSEGIKNNIPQHIAVIMDGNGRWAKKRFLPRTAGHKSGAKSARKLIENCVQTGIKVLTLFAFSSENWSRPQEEVETLMELFFSHLEKELPLFQEHQISIRVIGDTSKFSDKLTLRICETVRATKNNQRLVLVIAASYGGKWDITQAAKQLAQKVKDSEITLDQINDLSLGELMCSSDLPAPDLFIRTGGEQRISNFLLWQLAYTELFFTDALWPDFSDNDFKSAMDYYQQRQRRFGKTAEQVA